MRWIKKRMTPFMMGTRALSPCKVWGRSHNARRLQVRKYGVCFFVTGRLPWQPDGTLNLLRGSVTKNQHFRPCRKNYALDRKMINTFQNCHDVLYQHARFWGDRTTRADCRTENLCFFLYVTLGLPARGGHNSNKYFVTVYKSILMPFSALFQNRLFFQMHYIVLIFITRWRHNFREIAVKNCENPKNRRKSLCAPLLIDS